VKALRWLGVAFAAGAWAAGDTVLTAGGLADEVLAVNPTVAAAAARATSYERAAMTKGLWPDPQLMVEASNLPADDFSLARTPMSGWQFYVRERIPFPGKNTYRRRAATRVAGGVAAEYGQTRLVLVERAKHAYFDYYLAQTLADITAQQKTLWSQYERVATARYAAGRGLQQDVLTAQVERTRLANELLSLARREKVARGRINVLLNQPPDGELAPPNGLPEVRVPYTQKELFARAAANNPTLAAAAERRAAAEARRTLAKLSYVPDFTLGAGYRLREEVPMDPVAGEDFWSFSAGVSLPLFGTLKQTRAVDSKEAAVASAEASVTDVRNELLWKTWDIYAAVTTAEEQISLFDDGLLPQAEAAVRAAFAAYEAGKVDFATLARSQLALYKYQKEYVQLRVQRHKAIASLEAIIGERFY